MPTTKNTVTAYVTDDIKNCLSEYSREKGVSQSKALEEILEQFFKGDLPDNVPSNVLEATVAEVEKRLGESVPPNEVAIESIVEERMEKYHQQVENALQGIYQRLETTETKADSTVLANLSQRLDRHDELIKGIRGDVKRDLNEALTETRSRYTTVGSEIKKLWEKLADIEEALEAETPYTVEDTAPLEQIEQTTPTSPDAVPPTPQPSPDTNEPTPPQPTPPIVPRKTRLDGVEGLEGGEATPDVYTYEQLEDQFPLRRSTLESAKSRAKAKAKEKGKEWNGIIDSKGYTLQFVSEGSEGVKIRVLEVPEIAE